MPNVFHDLVHAFDNLPRTGKERALNPTPYVYKRINCHSIQLPSPTVDGDKGIQQREKPISQGAKLSRGPCTQTKLVGSPNRQRAFCFHGKPSAFDVIVTLPLRRIVIRFDQWLCNITAGLPALIKPCIW